MRVKRDTPWGPFPTYINEKLFSEVVRRHGFPPRSRDPVEERRLFWRHWARVYTDYTDRVIKLCDSLAEKLIAIAGELRKAEEELSSAISELRDTAPIKDRIYRSAHAAQLTLGRMYNLGCLERPPSYNPYRPAPITPIALREVLSGELLKSSRAAGALEDLAKRWEVNRRAMESFKAEIARKTAELAGTPL